MLTFSKCLRSMVFWTAVSAVTALVALLFSVFMEASDEPEAGEAYVDVHLFDSVTGAALGPDDVKVVSKHDRTVSISASGIILEKRKDLPWISVRDKETGQELCFKNIPEDAVSPVRLDIEQK